MYYLLDTNICVFYLRGKYDIDKRIDNVGWGNCYISEITELELLYGAELSLRKNGVDRFPQLRDFLEKMQILPITDIKEIAAREKIRLRLAGTPIDDDFDLIIASTAVSYNMVMVTDNLKDFKNIQGINIQNWIERETERTI